MEVNDRKMLYAFCSERSLLVGELLFDYNEPGKSLYFIEEGRLAVHKFTGFQEKMQVVALLEKGSIVGESGLLRNHVHQSKITVVEDCRLMSLSAQQYQKMQNENPDLALRFFAYLLKITTLRLEKTSERLARIL